jgi:hypothetical protein
MKYIKILAKLAIFTAVACMGYSGQAQTLSTASQQLDLSAFAAGTGTLTRIEGGKNAGITAGIDLTYLGLRLFRPSIEVRGSYPIKRGTIDSQENILAGIKVEHAFGRLHPYADFLVGRGQINYGSRGLPPYFPPNSEFFFLSTTTTVLSPGVGVDYNLFRQVALKADLQYQRWETPVTASGTVYPVALSFGGVYRFNFNPRGHKH